jgi:hypothetical protein
MLACPAPDVRRPGDAGLTSISPYPALRRADETASHTLQRHCTVVLPPLTVVSRSTLPVPHFEQRSGPEAERIRLRFAIVVACCPYRSSFDTILNPYATRK